MPAPKDINADGFAFAIAQKCRQRHIVRERNTTGVQDHVADRDTKAVSGVLGPHECGLGAKSWNFVEHTQSEAVEQHILGTETEVAAQCLFLAIATNHDLNGAIFEVANDFAKLVPVRKCLIVHRHDGVADFDAECRCRGAGNHL